MPRLLLGLAGALLALALSAPAQAQGPGTCVADLAISVDHDAGDVDLTWTATLGATSYHVARAVDGGPESVVAVLPGTATSFDDHPPEGIVSYGVAADGAPGSDCIRVETHLGGLPPPGFEAQCATGLVAQALDNGNIQLTWTAVPGALSYEVLRGEPLFEIAPYAVIGRGDITTFIDGSAENGLTYQYIVSANGLPPEGEACDVAEATAVPFAGVETLALASLAGLAAFAALRRR